MLLELNNELIPKETNMSHKVESMAYAFDATSKKEEYSHPWHKEWTLDKSVPVHNDMSAKEMLDWIQNLK